jgi:CHAT domain
MTEHGLQLELDELGISYAAVMQEFIRILLAEHAVAPRLELLEDALTLSDAELDGLEVNTPDWGMAMSLRSSIIGRRYDLRGDLADLDEQIQCLSDASKCHLKISSMIDVETRRVEGLTTRFSVQEDIRDLSAAITIAGACYQKYYGFDQGETVEFAELRLAHARACHAAFMETDDAEQLEECERLLRHGLETSGLPSVLEADFLKGLGIALSTKAIARKSVDTANEALEYFMKSLPAWRPGEAGYVNVVLNVAWLLSAEFTESDMNTRLVEWRPKILEILTGALGTEEELRACYIVADSYASEEDWVNAAKYATRWARSYRVATRRQASEQFREKIVHRLAGRLADTAVYQMLAGQTWEAVATLERNRMSLITDRFDLVSAVNRGGSAEGDRAMADIASYDRLAELERRMIGTGDSSSRSLRVLQEARRRRDVAYDILAGTEPTPDAINHSDAQLNAIRSVAASAPLVYVTAGRRGGMAIVIRDGHEPEPIRLPLLLTERILQITRDTYGSRRQPFGLAAAVETASAHLWDMCFERLIDVVAPGRYFVVPCGVLGLLPLHAAWAPDQDRPTGKVYATDFYEFSYCLSGTLRFQAKSQLQAAKQAGGRLPAVIVDNPADPDSGSLNISRLETAAMLRYFPDSLVLSDSDATVTNVVDALKSTSWAHFSCHGEADPLNPRESFLSLTNGERLRVQDS